MSEYDLFISMLKRAGTDFELNTVEGEAKVTVQNWCAEGYDEPGYSRFFSAWFFADGKLVAVGHWE